MLTDQEILSIAAGPWWSEDGVDPVRFARAIEARVLAAAPSAEGAKSGPAVAGWQPIETAPKDGSMFLCWVSAVLYGETDEGQQYQQDVSQADFCSWREGFADIPDCGYFDPCCGQIGDEQGITHWMPLPAAPSTEGGEHA